MVSRAIIDRKRYHWGITPTLDRWSFALGIVIINLGDQQVVTGISILLAALYRLQLEIQVYHWQAVVNLAWLSTMRHLITLTILRGEVRANRDIRVFRIIGMRLLIIMLVCVLGPVGYLESSDAPPPNFPAWCLYQPRLPWYRVSSNISSTAEGWVSTPISIPIRKTYNSAYVVSIVGILIFSFLSRVFALSSEVRICRYILRSEFPLTSLGK